MSLGSEQTCGRELHTEAAVSTIAGSARDLRDFMLCLMILHTRSGLHIVCVLSKVHVKCAHLTELNRIIYLK